jgi:CspA family cold shock protein
VSGKVKWYNPAKRYGFVELTDGSGDAFLHASALAGIGIRTLQSGATLELQVAPGQRGLEVTKVLSVDSSTAAPTRVSRTRGRSSSDRQPLEASVQEMGTVKWYSASRGFGFIVRDGGGKEVFLHASVLEGAGITHLHEGQRVFVGVAEGPRTRGRLDPTGVMASAPTFNRQRVSLTTNAAAAAAILVTASVSRAASGLEAGGTADCCRPG